MGFKFPRASDTVVAEIVSGMSPNAGKLRSYSRGDHTHGTLDLTKIASSLLPATTKTHDLGGGGIYWRDAYLTRLYLSALAGEGLGSHLYPVSKGVCDLGSATRYMRSVHFNRIRAIDLTVDTHHWAISSGFSPIPQDVLVFEWFNGSNIYEMLRINPTVGVQACTDVNPIDDNTFSLGNDTTPLRWANLFLAEYLKLGNVASLPTPDASYRGKMIRVENTAGDTLYVCEWNGSAYIWRQI